MSDATTDTVTEDEARAMVQNRATELGGVGKAAETWAVSPQMVHMVIKGTRRPSKPMLDDLGLEEIPPVVTYRRKLPSQ